MHMPIAAHRGRMYSAAAAVAVTAGLAVAPSAFANGFQKHHHPVPPAKPSLQQQHHHHRHHHHKKPQLRQHKP